MIRLHRLNGEEFILNSHHIETMETTPDTVITLTNDKKYVVRESAEEVIELVVNFKKSIYGGLKGNLISV